jgi:hypothetical protein
VACPLCTTRKARRPCPALDRTICAPCCGTKRLVEIRCPPDCPWLASAQAHPPAVVLRRRSRDALVLAPMLHDLPERPYLLTLLLLDVVRRHRKTALLPPLTDRDVQDAAAALAATLETADRGLIYEHQTASLPAQRLLQELRATVDEVSRRAEGSPAVVRDAAVALRRIEWGAREAAGRRGDTSAAGTALLDLLDRLPQDLPGDGGQGRLDGEAAEIPDEAPRIILP